MERPGLDFDLPEQDFDNYELISNASSSQNDLNPRSVSLRDQLNIGTIRIGHCDYQNVHNGHFDYSVLLSIRNDIKLKKASFKSHVVNVEEYDLQEHRKTLQLCSEIEILSPQSRFLITCLGYARKDFEERQVLRCTEETVIRLDQLLPDLTPDTTSIQLKLQKDLWDAYDHFRAHGYFLEVQIDCIYVDLMYNFKIGGLDQIRSLQLADKPFEDVMEQCLVPLLQVSGIESFFTQRILQILSHIVQVNDTPENPFSRPNSDLNIRDLYETIHGHLNTRIQYAPKTNNPYDTYVMIPYQQLKEELRMRLEDYLSYASVNLETEELDLSPLLEIEPVSSLPQEQRTENVFYGALEEVVAHNRKWKKTPNWFRFMEMALDASVLRMAAHIDQAIENAVEAAKSSLRVEKWSNQPFTSKEEDALLLIVVPRMCKALAEVSRESYKKYMLADCFRPKRREERMK